MADFKLTDEWDLDITNDNLSLIQTQEEETVQRLKIKFDTYLGEWYLDQTVGVPYFQTIFRKQTSKQVVDGIFKSIITEDRGVFRLNNYESSITSNYEYLAAFEAEVNSGEVVQVAFSTINNTTQLIDFAVNTSSGLQNFDVFYDEIARQFQVRVV